MAYDTAEFHQKVEELLQDWKVPGLAIAVVRGEGAPYAKVSTRTLLTLVLM